MGKPLPPYQQYDPNLVPGLDVFFSVITFKYSHSELSDTYQVLDDYGDLIMDLPLQNIMDMNLLENFGIEKLLRSLSLQRQEEADVFYSDATRNIKSPELITYDMVATDVLRARDRGITNLSYLCPWLLKHQLL